MILGGAHPQGERSPSSKRSYGGGSASPPVQDQGALAGGPAFEAVAVAGDSVGSERGQVPGFARVGREDSGQPSYRPEVFAAYKREIERRSPVIMNFSTGAVGLSKERMATSSPSPRRWAGRCSQFTRRLS